MNRPTERLPIDTIIVGDRLRQDDGDIAGLAESIRSWGLIHPLTVASDNTLIAGGRRLKALWMLGYEEVEVRRWEHLTDTERRELELEENLQRKDLTAFERSRKRKEYFEVASEVDKEQHPPRSESERGGNGRFDEQPGSLRRVSERIGIPVTTIHDAQRHVAIVEEVPEILGATQADALKIKSKLDAMPTEQRVETIRQIRSNDPDILADLTDRPRIPKDSINPHAYVKQQMAARKWRDAIADIRMRVNSVRDHGGIAVTTSKWSPAERAELFEEVDRLISQLTTIRSELEDLIDAA